MSVELSKTRTLQICCEQRMVVTVRCSSVDTVKRCLFVKILYAFIPLSLMYVHMKCLRPRGLFEAILKQEFGRE